MCEIMRASNHLHAIKLRLAYIQKRQISTAIPGRLGGCDCAHGRSSVHMKLEAAHVRKIRDRVQRTIPYSYLQNWMRWFVVLWWHFFLRSSRSPRVIYIVRECRCPSGIFHNRTFNRGNSVRIQKRQMCRSVEIAILFPVHVFRGSDVPARMGI